jgi:Ca2+-transporting ATPase
VNRQGELTAWIKRSSLKYRSCSPKKHHRNIQAVTDPHERSAHEVLRTLGVVLDVGLTHAEVKQRRGKFGLNRIRRGARKSTIAVLFAQFRSIIVYLLAGAAALSFSFGEWGEGAAIVAVLAINSAIGFITELRAVRSIEALRRLSRTNANVLRNGNEEAILAEELVPGDIVLLESGDVVPADIRLAKISNLQCDESALTGESVPVAKGVDVVGQEAVLGDRTNIAFKGTAVTRGAGAGVVVATGMATELGKIAALTETAEPETSPLEKRLDRLGGQLVWATLVLVAVIAVSGIYAGHDVLAVIKIAVALAVAAVPEGLPIVATIALSRGVWRMARRNALIKNLSAVESLGATTVLLTDKTGTLTENRMTAVRFRFADRDVRVVPGEGNASGSFQVEGEQIDPRSDNQVSTALRIAILCNNAATPSNAVDMESHQRIGDPMEAALLVAGKLAGHDRSALVKDWPRVREVAFSAESKMMATVHEHGSAYLIAVKGAPEEVIKRSTHVLMERETAPLDDSGRQVWLGRNDDLTRHGLRVLALATKTARTENIEPYDDLILVGLVGLLDPPRADVSDAIAACQDAGVRLVMLTGDHAGTARNIAAKIGLANEDATAIAPEDLKDLDRLSEEQRGQLLHAKIFARVSPETKLKLVSFYQAQGEVVAMTGDGVNDAPALKKADIGIAMGQRGTEVAREAAAMVLRDDAFPSIVMAMQQGRVIFDNIRKFVVYLLSCNLSEILVVGTATLGGLPLPLFPLQILYLNLVTDVFPALALAVSEGDPNIMRRPPRDSSEPILTKARWVSISIYGVLITAATLGVFIFALVELKVSQHEAVTASFLTLAIAQVLHVFNMRAPDSNPVRNEVTTNLFVWGAIALCGILLAAAIYAPGLSEVLGLAPPKPFAWILIAMGGAFPLIVGQFLLPAVTHQPGPSMRRMSRPAPI